MGSEGKWESDFEWDPAAEDELRAIEAAYASSNKRTGSSPPDSEPRSKTRRLPKWNRHRAAASSAADVSALWALAPSPCRVNVGTSYQSMKFMGRIVYSKTASEVEQATKEILDKIKALKSFEQVSLGFDIEWKPVFRRGEPQRKAAVLQICMDTANCYVMHIIHSGIPPILKSLLEDSSSVKVGVCVANDAWKMRKDYGVGVESLMDLSSLANTKFGGPPKKWSLSSLTEKITCKELEKPSKIRMGNWEADVLSKEKIQYAATDAFVSWYLYQALKGFPDVNIGSEDMEKVNTVS
ncbi:3'-5' exonuclease isoform X1 [Typha angustifolia]|uniref:3'-5' exonuclease isoform X1 n=1 Tax=Typha angustifolia TaxID=59011 RepID=UPI003C30AAA2